MKLVFISDTHGMHRRMTHPIPDGDVLIHCGDMTGRGSSDELVDVAQWLEAQPHKHKLVVAGNHDGWLEEIGANGAQTSFGMYGVQYLEDRAYEIDGVKFWGAPWTPNFCDWHFMPERGSEALDAHWKMIPPDTQVLITHGPPHGILDSYVEPRYIEKAGQVHVGCELLRKRVEHLDKCGLRVHAFGHIHEGYGKEHWPGGQFSPLTFVNAAICNRDYNPVNRPQVVDL